LPSPRRRSGLIPGWLSLALAVTFVLTGIAVSFFAFLTIEAVVAAAREPFNPLEEAAAAAAATVLPPLVQDGVAPVATLAPGEPTPTMIPAFGDSEDERINVLLMGIDRRPGEPFISRTDTMMLLSVNRQENTASLLSIPRDLYVVIPDRGRDRINTAFVYGAQGNNPAGGAQLALATVEYNLGVNVDHYFMVDFNAFIDVIDTLGGITVEVPYDINDPTFPDMNYGYDPLYIPAGAHEFDGYTALRYARTRHQDSDFYRAQRQQQVLMAIRDKALGLGIDDFILRAPILFQQIHDGIRTDLSLEQLVQLANIAKSIPSENINRAVLDHNYVTSYTTPGGASVLVLINESAAPLIAEMFYDN
jgi:LCP family protein required for cell wall assembly